MIARAGRADALIEVVGGRRRGRCRLVGALPPAQLVAFGGLGVVGGLSRRAHPARETGRSGGWTRGSARAAGARPQTGYGA